jgi:ergothioneine biosynthesis protein EgtB
MPDVSPTKWHLAHTTWFFETFVLDTANPTYRAFDASYGYLFNSYYNSVGAMHPRAERGLLSRPGRSEITTYRTYVDEHMEELLRADDGRDLAALRAVVILGLHHEQQHQELLLTDIKHVLACNPQRPVYRERNDRPTFERAPTLSWFDHEGGIDIIGHEGTGFAFDNEAPRHREAVEPFAIASRPVSNGEFAEFIADGGYSRPELWLSDGWSTVNEQQWRAPLYWFEREGRWRQQTLAGAREIDPAEPVTHLSYYEAEA